MQRRKVCGGRSKEQNGAPYFSVYIFLPKDCPLEKCAAKSDKEKNPTTTTHVLTKKKFKLTNHGHVRLGLCLYKACHKFICFAYAKWLILFFYTCHDFAPPGSGTRGKCLPPRYATGQQCVVVKDIVAKRVTILTDQNWKPGLLKIIFSHI